jgi:UDP:flavonoid glycosyltransferase YjiC (YdhE family)
MGDLHPFLALADELRRHNHQPVLAFSPYFESQARELGLKFIPIGPDLQQIQHNINSATMETPESVEEMRGLLAPLMSELPRVYEELSMACVDADVLISGSSQPASRIIHEVTGIPFVSIQVSHFDGGGTTALQQASASFINPFRAKLGLPPLRCPLTSDANSPQLSLYAMSRYVQPPQSDWPDHYHMTGYFFLDNKQWQPGDELRDFVEGCDPPVVITFGSMAHKEPETLTRLIVKSIDLARRRAVIQRGWSGLGQRHLPSNIFVSGFIPHAWLFQRAACVVHHGGGGTAGMVFRSGVPSVFVPHTMFDQHYWAMLAESLGCATAAISYSELTAERLASAISTILTDPRFRKTAAELGEKIRQEQGVRQARLLIEQLVHKIGLRKGEVAQRLSREARARKERVTRRKEVQQGWRSRKADVQKSAR